MRAPGGEQGSLKREECGAERAAMSGYGISRTSDPFGRLGPEAGLKGVRHELFSA